MTTMVLEVSEANKTKFEELAKKLKTKYDVLNYLEADDEDIALFNAMNISKAEGKMT
jgi:hypothetical protein